MQTSLFLAGLRRTAGRGFLLCGKPETQSSRTLGRSFLVCLALPCLPASGVTDVRSSKLDAEGQRRHSRRKGDDHVGLSNREWRLQASQKMSRAEAS